MGDLIDFTEYRKRKDPQLRQLHAILDSAFKEVAKRIVKDLELEHFGEMAGFFISPEELLNARCKVVFGEEIK